MRGTIAALALAAQACGGATVDLRQVRSSAYDTDFATVWNAVSAEMHDRFHDEGIRLEDAARGTIISKWKSVPTTVSQEPVVGSDYYHAPPGGSAGPPSIGIGGDMIQIRVRIGPAGPPWHVLVDGEGAHRSADSPVLKPYPRGNDEEPLWIQGKVDAVSAGIYERLKNHAVVAPSPSPP